MPKSMYDSLAWNTQWQPISGKQFKNFNSLPGANVWKNTTNKGGSIFSTANAGKTAKVAGAWQLGLSALASIFDKSKKGQPGPQTAVGKDHLTAGLHDWTQFFS